MSLIKCVESRVEEGNQNVGIEQEPHGSSKWANQEILGQRLVEIIGNIGDNCAHPMLALEFAHSFQVKPALARCGTRSKTGFPLRVTTTVSPFSTSRASAVRRFFASLMDTVVMIKDSHR